MLKTVFGIQSLFVLKTCPYHHIPLFITLSFNVHWALGLQWFDICQFEFRRLENFLVISLVFPKEPFSASYKWITGRFGFTIDSEIITRARRGCFLLCRNPWPSGNCGWDWYLKRLGNIDPDWELSCLVRREVDAVVQPYYHVLQDRWHQARQTILLSHFKKKSEEPSLDPFGPYDP
jgi:hypothetical protein